MGNNLEQTKRNLSLWSKWSVVFALLIICAALLFTIRSSFATEFRKNLFAFQSEIISPVSSFSRLAVADNIWFPQSEILGTETNTKISAQSAFFVDADTGQVLFSQNSHQRLKIASLTKIMTAIVALEHRNLDDNYLVSDWAAQMMPDKMYLKSGDQLTLNELLTGLFLVSANDSAEVLAEQSVENRVEFIRQMNDKARQLGMNETLFVNPTGLDNDDSNGFSLDGDQYSTAYDVSLMARYAIKRWPALLNITSRSEIQLSENKLHQSYYLESKISLVRTYPGVMGFKTGYTDGANFTLVTVAQKEGRTVIGVLLSAPGSRDDAITLLDYSFKKIGVL